MGDQHYLHVAMLSLRAMQADETFSDTTRELIRRIIQDLEMYLSSLIEEQNHD